MLNVWLIGSHLILCICFSLFLAPDECYAFSLVNIFRYTVVLCYILHYCTVQALLLLFLLFYVCYFALQIGNRCGKLTAQTYCVALPCYLFDLIDCRILYMQENCSQQLSHFFFRQLFLHVVECKRMIWKYIKASL